jgi:hypothetical protein
MPRNSMLNLITRVRNLIGDPEGAAQVFTDDDIEESLDYHYDTVNFASLEVEPTLTSSTTTYTRYHAPDRVGDWEEDAVLYNSSYTALATDTEDYIRGRWVLTTSTTPPVYIVGQTYDVNAAAADLLKKWANKLKLEYSGTIDGRTLNRDEQYRNLMRSAREFESKARPHTLRLVRNDIAAI